MRVAYIISIVSAINYLEFVVEACPSLLRYNYVSLSINLNCTYKLCYKACGTGATLENEDICQKTKDADNRHTT